MVDATPTNQEPTSRDEAKQLLRARCKEIIDSKDKIQITKSVDDGNIECRVDWDETGKVICLAEMHKVMGLTPDDFKQFFADWVDVILQVNPLLIEAKTVEEDQGCQIIQTMAQCPWPVSNRSMVTCKYEDFDKEEGTHSVYMSSRWNDVFKEKYFDSDKKLSKKNVLATLYISAWEVSPIKDEDGNIVGSHCFYAYHADAGGMIPTFLQNRQGPKTAIDSLQGAVKFLTKRK